MLMVTMLTMLTMMTMMLTMMGPLSLIPNFSPNCSSRLSAYLDFNQQMPIVYRVKSWSGSPDQKRLLSPFLPGLSISDWGLFVHSRPGHIGRRQVLPCYVPAKIHCHQNWHSWATPLRDHHLIGIDEVPGGRVLQRVSQVLHKRDKFEPLPGGELQVLELLPVSGLLHLFP